jgi:hypothetical protein
VPSPSPAVSRRTAVGGTLAAAMSGAMATGCTPKGIDRRPRRRPSADRSTAEARTDPDVALAATVLADEQEMLDLVEATVRRHAGLTRVLAGARQAHRAHVDLLTDAVPSDERTTATSPAGSPTGSPSGSPTGSPTGGPTTDPATPVPARPPAALVALARREEQLSLVGKRSAFEARSGAFARVVAGMAAAAAQQAVVLSEAAAARR